MTPKQTELLFQLAKVFNEIAEECQIDDTFHNVMIANNDLFTLSLDEYAAEWYALAEGTREIDKLVKSISFYYLGSVNHRLNIYVNKSGLYVAEVLTDGHIVRDKMQWGGSEMFKPYRTIAGMLKAVNNAGYPIVRNQLGGL